MSIKISSTVVSYNSNNSMSKASSGKSTGTTKSASSKAESNTKSTSSKAESAPKSASSKAVSTTKSASNKAVSATKSASSKAVSTTKSASSKAVSAPKSASSKAVSTTKSASSKAESTTKSASSKAVSTTRSTSGKVVSPTVSSGKAESTTTKANSKTENTTTKGSSSQNVSAAKSASSKAVSTTKNSSKESDSKFISTASVSRMTNEAVTNVSSNSYHDNKNSNLTSNMHSSIIGAVNFTKYIADAPAIYTCHALKITGSNHAPSLKEQLSKGYAPGMPDGIYKKVKNSVNVKYHGKNITINKMLANIDKNKSLKLTADQKEAMLYAGEKLLNADYDARFVAGVLGNIMNEGVPGKFESSYYKSKPKDEPYYLRGMDADFDYRNKYSGKSITEVGIKDAVKLQEDAEKITHTYYDNGKKQVVIDMFGFGMCQFTGGRAGEVLGAYEKFYEKTGENDPTERQCLEIEVNFMMNELKSEKYSHICGKWKKGDKTAYDAGYLFCTEYEKPKDMYMKAKKRGNNATEIYKIMKKQ